MALPQETLYIRKGAICVISTFAVKFENITTEEIIQALHPGEINPRSRPLSEVVSQCRGRQPIGANKPELCSCCQSGDEFHNGVNNDNSYYCERFHVRSFSLKRETAIPLEVNVILSVFKNLNLAHLEFSIPVKDITDTEFVFLKHRFYEGESQQGREWKQNGKDIILSLKEECIEMNDYPGILKDLCCQLMDEIRRNIPVKPEEESTRKSREKTSVLPNAIVDNPDFVCPLVFYYFISEIQDVGSLFSTETNLPVETIIKKYGRSLYGILTSDEGFAFVPHELVSERLKNRWGSRNFTTCFVFGKSALSLNFKNSSNIGHQYVQMQKSRTNFTDIRRNYFIMAPCIAGLDHGILTCTERSIILFFELRYAYSLLSQDIQTRQIHAITQLHQKRQSIIHLLNESQQVISEVNELFLLICRENKVLHTFEEIKFQLDLRTEDLSFSYQESNDTLIKRLTIITAVISILAITSETMINREKVMFFAGLEESTLIYYVIRMLYYTSILAIVIIPFALVYFILKREKVKTALSKLQHKRKTPEKNK